MAPAPPAMHPAVLTIPLPEYDLSHPLDHEALGPRLDRLVLSHFPDGDYVDRSIGLRDHPGRTRADLVALILERGTDLYDPSRNSFCAEDFSDYRYDIHGGSFTIRAGALEFEPDGFRSYFAGTLYDFQHHAKLDRGYSVRVDLVMIYDAAALLPPLRIADHKPSSAGYAKYLYRFRTDVEGKGLLGIIVIEE